MKNQIKRKNKRCNAIRTVQMYAQEEKLGKKREFKMSGVYLE